MMPSSWLRLVLRLLLIASGRSYVVCQGVLGSVLPNWRQSAILTEAASPPLSLIPLRDLLPAWSLALLISGVLVWSGNHWPTPLLEQAWARSNPALAVALALALVLGLPVVIAALLVLRMRRHRDKGESSDCAHGEH